MRLSLVTFLVIAQLLFQGCKNNDATFFSELNKSETGIDFRNVLVEDEALNIAHYIYFYNGGGVAVGDINNDGLIDIFFTGNMVKNRLYLNKGNFTFENITEKSGVAAMQGWCTGAVMVDINHDGLLDIYVCRSADDNAEKRRNLLFINNGDLTFSEQAAQYGLDDSGYSTQATFFDYDKDGDLDCFVLNHSLSKYSTGAFANPDLRNQKNPDFSSRLYKNTNDHFTDVSETAGLNFNVFSFGLGIALSDFNNDGWPDMYISNDFKEPDYFYINNKDGTFSESFSECFDISSLNSMGSDAADYNNDGLTDMITLDMLSEDNYLQKTHTGPDNFNKNAILIKKGLKPQYVRNMLQKNNGDGTFSEIGQQMGISNTDWSWAALLCDFDGDMYKDLLITNGFVKDFSDLDFMNFSSDRLVRANKGEMETSFKEIIDKMPIVEIPNYIYHNNKGQSFQNTIKEWGFDKKVISAGAAYADLDNDGRMDIVISNTNDYAGIYKNNGITKDKNNYLSIKLQGDKKNPDGIGSKVKLFCNGQQLYQEQFPVRGYQSSVDPILNFGVGKNEMIDSILIIWPDDQYQVLQKVKSNQLLKVKIGDAVGKWLYHTERIPAFFSADSTIEYTHRENDFNDFTVQSLLPNYLSRQGPCMAKADINKDGLEDLFIGGAKGQPGTVFLQNKNGSFMRSNQPDIAIDSASEDVGAGFFDANGDGYMDLYVASGGYEFTENDPLLQDRLYINDGKGNFKKSEKALPSLLSSKGCVAFADIDGDKDLDIFVGGRVVPGKYPVAPQSYILLNDGKGNFTDATTIIAPALKNIGMVTDAVFTDVNHDGTSDLIMVGEWMPIKIFINTKGKQTDASDHYIKFVSSGWWNKILLDDFDGDGDMDLVLANTGTNAQFKPTDKEPMSMYYKDFDGNGSVDPIFCYYINGTSYPAATRDDLVEQLPMLKKKFNDYRTYASATINDVFSTDQLRDAKKLSAEITSTIYLQNNGDAGFELKPLPPEAQYAPVYAMASADVNNDGKKDIILAGNNAWTRIKFGRYRANHGVVLLGDGKAGFDYLPQIQSGLNFRADIRSMEFIKTAKGNLLVAGANDDKLLSYNLQSHNSQ
ncbi:MAG: VCBS repeat-containing protein [Agriterribacter sp.]